jgi:AcrR family transcriptional regulator
METPERTAAAARRTAGRTRPHDDAAEQSIIVDAGFVALRAHGTDLTIAHILSSAGVSTRSFYRHFESKDALLCAMYRRDAERVAGMLAARVAAASSPHEAVAAWIDEIFTLGHHLLRAEPSTVLRSVTVNHADGIEAESMRARSLLVAPLVRAIDAGVQSGVFTAPNATLVADLILVSVMHASGLSPTSDGGTADQAGVASFCLRALAAATSSSSSSS